jgi:uncharacterized protein YjbJ (UPF0337 family)
MEGNRLEGTARNLGGKVQKGIGRVTGDAKTQAEGIGNQVRGKAEDLYGKPRITREIRQAVWIRGCARRSKRSPTLRSSLPCRLVGCSAGFTARSNLEPQNALDSSRC